MSKKTALILLSKDAEEIETVTAADVLTRGGIEVTIAGLSGKEGVKCSRGVVIVPDKSLDEIMGQSFDAIVMPGGFIGSTHLVSDPRVGQLLREHQNSNKLIAAICAAPLAFKAHGIGLNKRITSHPLKAKELQNHFNYCGDRVVVDGQLITSQGIGTALEWALAIVEKLAGTETLKQITPIMILKE